MKKRILSLFMLLCMLVSLMPVSVFADAVGELDIQAEEIIEFEEDFDAEDVPEAECYAEPEETSETLGEVLEIGEELVPSPESVPVEAEEPILGPLEDSVVDIETFDAPEVIPETESEPDPVDPEPTAEADVLSDSAPEQEPADTPAESFDEPVSPAEPLPAEKPVQDEPVQEVETDETALSEGSFDEEIPEALVSPLLRSFSPFHLPMQN